MFDVNAKIPEGGDKQVPAMLQQLLAERFQIKLHKDSKPLPVYELAVAKSGFKLKEIDPEELKKMAEAADNGPGRGNPNMPPPPPPPPPGAGGGGNMMMMMSVAGPGGRGGPGGARMTMSSNGATTVSGKMNITQLVNVISRAVDRPILDATNLQGVYDISLTYLADPAQMGGMGAGPMGVGMAGGMAGPGGDAAHQPEATAPIATIFQALKSIGLTLDPKKSPFDIWVIDSASKTPTEN
jgi:uncharacterized protein (TIGR03435 family)